MPSAIGYLIRATLQMKTSGMRVKELRRRLLRRLRLRRDLEHLELDTTLSADDERWANDVVKRHGWDELREKK